MKSDEEIIRSSIKIFLARILEKTPLEEAFGAGIAKAIKLKDEQCEDIVRSYLEKNKSEYPDFMNGTDSYAFGMKEGWNAAFTAIINGLFGEGANSENCEK